MDAILNKYSLIGFCRNNLPMTLLACIHYRATQFICFKMSLCSVLKCPWSKTWKWHMLTNSSTCIQTLQVAISQKGHITTIFPGILTSKYTQLPHAVFVFRNISFYLFFPLIFRRPLHLNTAHLYSSHDPTAIVSGLLTVSANYKGSTASMLSNWNVGSRYFAYLCCSNSAPGSLSWCVIEVRYHAYKTFSVSFLW